MGRHPICFPCKVSALMGGGVAFFLSHHSIHPKLQLPHQGEKVAKHVGSCVSFCGEMAASGVRKQARGMG